MRAWWIVGATAVLCGACRDGVFKGERETVDFISTLGPLGRTWDPALGVARPSHATVCVHEAQQPEGEFTLDPAAIELEPGTTCLRLVVDAAPINVSWSGRVASNNIWTDTPIAAEDAFVLRPREVAGLRVVDPLAFDPEGWIGELPPVAVLPDEVALVPGLLWSGWFEPIDSEGNRLGFDAARASVTCDREDLVVRFSHGFVELGAAPGTPVGPARLTLSYDGHASATLVVHVIAAEDIARVEIVRYQGSELHRLVAVTRSGMPVLQPPVTWSIAGDVRLQRLSEYCHAYAGSGITRCEQPDADPLEIPDRLDLVVTQVSPERTNDVALALPLIATVPGTNLSASFRVVLPKRPAPPAVVESPPPARFGCGGCASVPSSPLLLLGLLPRRRSRGRSTRRDCRQ